MILLVKRRTLALNGWESSVYDIFITYCRIPVLKLENAKGLSNDKALELEKEVQCMAADLVGEVIMIEYVLEFCSPGPQVLQNWGGVIAFRTSSPPPLPHQCQKSSHRVRTKMFLTLSWFLLCFLHELLMNFAIIYIVYLLYHTCS